MNEEHTKSLSPFFPGIGSDPNFGRYMLQAIFATATKVAISRVSATDHRDPVASRWLCYRTAVVIRPIGVGRFECTGQRFGAVFSQDGRFLYPVTSAVVCYSQDGCEDTSIVGSP